MTEAPMTEAPADTSVGGDLTEICALAEQIDTQESFPTEEQLASYQELAPPEIADAVDVAAPAFIATGGDMVQFFIVYAQDEVEQSLAEINAWETENCGIDHGGEPGSPLEGGATRELEDGAAVVDVVATDYAFELDTDAIAPGRTSFVLTNEGAEAHFLSIMRIGEGYTMDDVMAADDAPDGMIEGVWDSGVAAPGGDDDEVVTLDLEPGTYGIACWISGADGTPHAFMGMTGEFTVA